MAKKISLEIIRQRGHSYAPKVVVRKGKPVCSECGEPLQPFGFGGGNMHWTCGCELEEEK
ncbi:MAG TPA: hypothetical protein VN577_09940 [Terriglobales bacterium]|nr:hypothetical protein [Terriglobales bacterium]